MHPAKAGGAVQVEEVFFYLRKGAFAQLPGVFVGLLKADVTRGVFRCQEVRPAHRYFQMGSSVGLQVKDACEI